MKGGYGWKRVRREPRIPAKDILKCPFDPLPCFAGKTEGGAESRNYLPCFILFRNERGDF
jgi:hypothetical protein